MTAHPPRIDPRRRVTIVGGGLAGLTAAYELSRTPELRARYAVTVYTLGWRLGGKLASGRNVAEGWRNEEHGLHVWFGFYDNAFALADEVLQRWNAPDGCRLESVWDLVTPHHVAMHAEPHGDAHRIHRFHLPRTGGGPGTGRVADPVAGLGVLVDLLRVVPRNLLDLAGIAGPGPSGRLPAVVRDRLWRPAGVSPGALHRRLERLADRLSQVLGAPTPRARQALADPLRRLAARTQRLVGRLVRRAPADARWLQLVTGIDLCLATVRGVLDPRYGVLVDGDLDRLNAHELSAWLRSHGADARSVQRNLMLKGAYDAFFQYADSDRERPSFEAGTAVRIIVRVLGGYQGAIAWMLTTGMGEGFIAPLYEVLRDQGVRFQFFHRLQGMELSPDGCSLAGLRFVRQARVGDDYEPLVTHDGLRVWLSEPDWDQIDDGPSLRDRGVDFESRWSPPATDEPVALRHGVDFDEVVLALPLGSIKPDCDGQSPCRAWLDATPHVRRAVKAINVQATAAAQLWVDGPLTGAPGPASVICWPAPYSIFCDMSAVIADESWAAPVPVSSIYLCGVWDFEATRASSDDAAAHHAAQRQARECLDQMLDAHGSELFGEASVTSVFCNANVEPHDLCDSAVPNTAHLRPEAHESGLRNLALASTWVRTGINSTCVEAATMSGMAAARALGVSGRTIVGEDFLARPMSKALLPSVQLVGP